MPWPQSGRKQYEQNIEKGDINADLSSPNDGGLQDKVSFLKLYGAAIQEASKFLDMPTQRNIENDYVVKLCNHRAFVLASQKISQPDCRT
jgi:hypothetical protein